MHTQARPFILLLVVLAGAFLFFSPFSRVAAPAAPSASSASILRRALGRSLSPPPPAGGSSFGAGPEPARSAVVPWPPDAAVKRPSFVAAGAGAAPPPRAAPWFPPELLSAPPPPRVPPARGAPRAVGLDRSTLQGGDSGDAPEVGSFPAIKLDRNDGAWLNLAATNPAPAAEASPPHGVAPLSRLPYPPGMPTVVAYNRAVKSALFKAMERFSDAFLQVNAALVAEYGWSRDPLHAWSRRYEYVWAAEAIMAALPPAIAESLEATWPALPAARAGADFTVVDAASGFTFFTQFLASRLGCRVVALDHDTAFRKLFKGAAPAPIAGEAPSSVVFTPAKVEASGIAPNSVDVVAYVGAMDNDTPLEHIYTEFHRILKPGGRLLVTFNVGMPPLARDKKAAAEAMEMARRFFQEDVSHGAGQESRAARVVFTNRRVRWRGAPRFGPPPSPLFFVPSLPCASHSRCTRAALCCRWCPRSFPM